MAKNPDATQATDASRVTHPTDPTTDGTHPTHATQIVRAAESDVPIILQMIRGLAEYERMADEVVATEAGLRESLFGARPDAEVLLAYADGQPAGFALYFHNYSTFVGRRGLYLEDLFVKPAFRGRGIGKRLLVELARIAVERGCGRFEWTVLDWNEPAIGFYKSLGAQSMDAWRIFRVTGDALTRLAGSLD
jgi:GNAT superfamily N-acetyltransferase